MRHMDDDLPFLLPVVMDRTSDAAAFVPERFREVQWTRLTDTGSLDSFCRQVHGLVAATSQAPSSDESPTNDHCDNRPSPASALETKVAHARAWVKFSIPRAAFLGGLGFVAAALFFNPWQREDVLRQLRDETLPEIDRSISNGDFDRAFVLATQAERLRPNDPELRKRWPKVAYDLTIESAPPGADVYVKPYHQPKAEWRPLGRTPLAAVRLPRSYARWRVEKEGFASLDVQQAVRNQKVSFTLKPSTEVPPDMVWVHGGPLSPNSTGLEQLLLADYLIDRFEVTNRQFKQFVDRDGYRKPEFWRQPFAKAGRTLTHQEAMAAFRDSTGDLGPATWRNGTFPEGAAELPVAGVSWFEAAAYAEWAGKRLPSVYHWRFAAVPVVDSESIVPLSNFSGRSLAPVGSYQGVSACGAFDMAGNVKEWCWNAATPDVRYVLGGAWREPDYMFVQADALSPFDRSESNGFRCIKLVGSQPLPTDVDAPVEQNTRDFLQEQPVSDEVFAAFRSLYAYDKAPLEARLDNSDDADPRWRKEKVSYRAAYGDERMSAHLFLPKNATPPYQAIVYFPGAGAIRASSFENNLRDLDRINVLVASGRALLHPVYKGTYERHEAGLVPFMVGPTAAYRDWVIMLSKDLGRSIDYLETRADIQRSKLAYVGSSWGGALGAMLPAVEPRIKVNILIIGGFQPGKPFPEVDQLNFVTRNTVPTLMLGGRYDFRFPLETSQRPMFHLLGAPSQHKRHVPFDTGHALKSEQIASEAYAWLDQYLGLVK
jgi:eukaryotic-like serine/threonine-protein kinase